MGPVVQEFRERGVGGEEVVGKSRVRESEREREWRENGREGESETER